MPDRDRVQLIGELERLKAGAAAAQARLVAAMADEHLGHVKADDRRAHSRVLRSVASQVGLARRVSPARARTFVGLARLLCHDMPATLAALGDGEISQWQATLIARETVVLSAADRREVDRSLARGLGAMGDRRVAQEARRLADRVDEDACARRVRRAEADRRVTVRPAPGPAGCAMARLTATMPVARAVAAYAALRQHADSARSAGDPRGLGQLMCDELSSRLLATSAAADGPSIEVGLVLTEQSLLRGGSDPAVLTDDEGRAFGQVPATLARRLVRDADRVWLSRLYASPESGELLAMDARRRTFTGRLRKLLIWRDQTCRMPWCEAPVRHGDHVSPYAAGGLTTLPNGAGLCEACNYVKQAPGWSAAVVEDAGHTIEFTTPSGHRYRSQAPPAPGHRPDGPGTAD